MTLVLAVLLFAAPAAAPGAPGAPGSAGTKLEQGQKAFAEGKFDIALKALDAAAAEARDAPTLEKVHLLRGQCLAARMDFGRAEEAFALALEANPEAALDPGKVDPAVVKLLESMRARSSGTLSVESTPPGAQLSLDGADAGVAPVTLTTGIGRHKVKAQWSPDAGAEARVMVRSKRETFVELVLHEREKVVEKIVEKVVEKRVEVPVEPPPPERFVRPYVAVRGSLDVNAGPEGGLDLGIGADFKYLSIGAYVRPYPYVYLIPRVAGLWPVFDVLNVFLEAEVDIRLGRLGVALGGNLGVEYFAARWLGIFVSAGGKGFFVNQGFVVDVRLNLAGGVRLRVP